MNNEVLEQLKQEYNETLKHAQDIGEIIANCIDIDTNHCGQDAEEEARVSLNELLGMKVICVGGSAMKCEDCSWNCDNCVKVELVGGDYICLAEPEQDKPNVISFDEEDTGKESLLDIMAEIKEEADNFMDYLDSVVNG